MNVPDFTFGDQEYPKQGVSHIWTPN
jgi:hypothetical protein